MSWFFWISKLSQSSRLASQAVWSSYLTLSSKDIWWSWRVSKNCMYLYISQPFLWYKNLWYSPTNQYLRNPQKDVIYNHRFAYFCDYIVSKVLKDVVFCILSQSIQTKIPWLNFPTLIKTNHYGWSSGGLVKAKTDLKFILISTAYSFLQRVGLFVFTDKFFIKELK